MTAHAPQRRPPRRTDLDRAKGLAILLVVFGHLVAAQEPEGVTWYEPLRQAVYLFHMPFFFYLSGTVAFLTGACQVPRVGWPDLVARRARRLLLPFLLFGLLILAAKLVAQRLVPVDNVPPGAWQGLVDLVWRTDHSPATSVWYLLVLFEISIAVPVLVALDGGRLRLLPVVALVLFMLPVPPVFYLDRLCGHLVFFVAGILAAAAGARWTQAIDRWRWASLAGFAGLLATALAAGIQPSKHHGWFLLTGLVAMPALHGLVRAPGLDRSDTLLTLGRFSLAIYLLNTICIGVAKGGLLRVMPWGGDQFALFAAALMAAGVLGPMLAKRFVLRQIPALDRMTD